MRILRLEAKNLATYDDIKIDFTQLNYPVFVEGRTGAGKTTLFVDAITAALYGAAYGRKGLLKEIVMKGKTRAKINLVFEVNGEVYEVEREIPSETGLTSAFRLYHIDKEKKTKKPISFSTSESQRFIDRLIGLSYEALAASTIVRQGDVYGFIDAKPAERRDLIINMLRLGIFEKYKDRASELIKEKESIKKRYEGEISQLTATIAEIPKKEEALRGLREEKPRVERELVEKEREAESLEKELERVNGELQKIAGELAKLEVKSERLKGLEAKRDKLEHELKQFEEELKLLPRKTLEIVDELNESIYKLDSISKEIKLLENDIKNLKEAIDEMKKIESYRERINFLSKKLESLSSALDEFEELKVKKNLLNTKIEDAQRHLEALKAGEGKCPVCGRPLTEELKVKREGELKNELSILRRELEEVIKKIEVQEELKQKLEKIKEEFISKKAKIEQKEREFKLKRVDPSELEDKEKRKYELVKEYADILSNLETHLNTRDPDQAKQRIKHLQDLRDKIRDADSKKKELEEIKVEIESLRSELSVLPKFIEEKRRLEREKASIQNRLKESQNELKTLSNRLTEISTRISQLEEELSVLRQKQRELEEKKAAVRELEEDIKALQILANKVFAPSELPTKLLEDYLKVIEELTNRYLEAFGQDIRIRFKLEKRGDRSQILIKTYHQAYERTPETFSGGERTLIGFSLRLAIGKLISKIQTSNVRPRFLIIDEGFGPLDEELRIKVADALTALLEEKEFDQIIVISHHRELRDSPMFKSIIRIEKKDGKSTVTIER